MNKSRNKIGSKLTKRAAILMLVATMGVATTHAQIGTNYFGEAENIPIDTKTKEPVNGLGGDVFGSDLYIDGNTDVSLDLMSIQAELHQRNQAIKASRKNKDTSLRRNITSGEPVTILITPDHFTQISFMRDGEIVYPRIAYPGQPGLLNIDKDENSPFLYVSATQMMEGQTTNMFVETFEDGRIQTYVFNMVVTTPKNIREQVQVNLVSDLTPPLKGGVGSDAERRTQAESLLGLQSQSNSGREASLRIGAGGVHGKFNREDIKTYFNTMIQMAEQYGEAKRIEQESNNIIYRDQDITPYPGSKVTYIDPVEGNQWRVREVWFFPKYDAILLGAVCLNNTNVTSMWDYAQMKWKVNQRNPPFDTTAASPVSMQTPPNKANVIWFLIQGNRLDPLAEYSPVFPRAARRGENYQSRRQMELNPNISK